MRTKRILPCLFVGCLLASYSLQSQVFMRAFDPAAALALGGATTAYPGMEAGLYNEAASAWGKSRGLWLSSAVPYAIQGWTTASLQAFTPIDANSGAALDLSHNGTDAYAEQRLRLAYGRRLGARFTFGGSIDAMRVSAPDYGSAAAASFGLGVLAEPIPNLWLGARVQNPLQIKLGKEVLPTVLRVGAAWPCSSTAARCGKRPRTTDAGARRIGIQTLAGAVAAGRRTQRAGPGFPGSRFCPQKWRRAARGGRMAPDPGRDPGGGPEVGGN